MKVSVLIDVICNEKTGQDQKYKACTLSAQKISKIKGVQHVVYVGNPEGDLTVLADWNEDDIPQRIQELQKIEGVKRVRVQTLVPA